MVYQVNAMNFNPKPSTIMHLDLNSCFAAVEQQANFLIRGKPVAVAAYTTPGGCILASSIEAKKYGIKTGMKVKEGKLLCPSLIVLPSDPAKYRNVHLKLRRVLSDYTEDFTPKSIDEFVLNLEGKPALSARTMQDIAFDIKKRIKKEIGEWLTVSVGIAPNRFLAKLGASLHKRDGLDEIDKNNFQAVYSKLSLEDLCGIKLRNTIRLNRMGIYSVTDFYNAPIWKLRAAFNSIVGYYWYIRLRGYEVDNVVFGRRSYGNSYALPKPFVKVEELSPILTKLVEKMGMRLRRAGYKAEGIHLAVSFRNGYFWHKGRSTGSILFDSREMFKEAYKLLLKCPYVTKYPVANLAVSVFRLMKDRQMQLEFFSDIEKKYSLVRAVDKINQRWGNFVVFPARMIGTESFVPDRIAFGEVEV